MDKCVQDTKSEFTGLILLADIGPKMILFPPLPSTSLRNPLSSSTIFCFPLCSFSLSFSSLSFSTLSWVKPWYIGKAGLKIIIFLSYSPEYWNYKHVPPLFMKMTSIDFHEIFREIVSFLKFCFHTRWNAFLCVFLMVAILVLLLQAKSLKLLVGLHSLYFPFLEVITCLDSSRHSKEFSFYWNYVFKVTV